MALREGNRKKPVYEIHKWWARRQGSIFRNILIGATTPANRAAVLRNGAFYNKYDLSGLVVLDPFVGGGTSVVEAAKCGATVIGIDIDPVACFVTARELEPIRDHALRASFRAVEKEAKRTIVKWYRTRLSGGKTGTVVHAFWVDILPCPFCKSQLAAHPHFQLYRDQARKKQTVFCAHCGEVRTLPISQRRFKCKACSKHTNVQVGVVKGGKLRCDRCGATTKVSSLFTGTRPAAQKMFALEVLVDGTNGRVFKRADPDDVALYEAAKRAFRSNPAHRRLVPSERIPIRHRNDPRPVSFGYRRYRDLFNYRQKLCLSLLARAIRKVKDTRAREFLAAAFSDALAANNMFCFYAFDYQKLTPLFGLHAFYKISRPVENNVWGTQAGRGSFLKCYWKLLRGKRYCRFPFEYRYSTPDAGPEQVFTGEWIRPVVYSALPAAHPSRPYAAVLNQSSESLAGIPSESVNLILTDPPYYDNLAYSELSDFYHVWLKRLGLPSYQGAQRTHTPIRESLYVRRAQQRAPRDHDRFAKGLSAVFAESYRVLKRSGLLVFTFHHKDDRGWLSVGHALYLAGFSVTKVFPVRSEGQSQFHSADGNLKWDAVFCCRKRRSSRPAIELGRKRVSTLISRARKSAGYWSGALKRAGLEFGAADKTSLTFAFAVAWCCNAGLDPLALKPFMSVHGEHARRPSAQSVGGQARVG